MCSYDYIRCVRYAMFLHAGSTTEFDNRHSSYGWLSDPSNHKSSEDWYRFKSASSLGTYLPSPLSGTTRTRCSPSLLYSPRSSRPLPPTRHSKRCGSTVLTKVHGKHLCFERLFRVSHLVVQFSRCVRMPLSNSPVTDVTSDVRIRRSPS